MVRSRLRVQRLRGRLRSIAGLGALADPGAPDVGPPTGATWRVVMGLSACFMRHSGANRAPSHGFQRFQGIRPADRSLYCANTDRRCTETDMSDIANTLAEA